MSKRKLSRPWDESPSAILSGHKIPGHIAVVASKQLCEAGNAHIGPSLKSQTKSCQTGYALQAPIRGPECSSCRHARSKLLVVSCRELYRELLEKLLEIGRGEYEGHKVLSCLRLQSPGIDNPKENNRQRLPGRGL